MATLHANRVSRNGHRPKTNDIAERPNDWEFTYDPGAEYPEVEFGHGLTIQLVWLTPEVAAEWKGKLPNFQRSLKKYHLASLVEDHNEGRFKLNGEPVIFDRKDQLVNGQHRVNVVIITGKPMLVTVIRNVDPSVYTTYDITSKRRSADALRMMNVKYSETVSPAVSLLERYERGLIGKSVLNMSPAATTEKFNDHPGMEASAAATHLLAKEFPSHSAMAMCHYVLSSIDRKAAELFFSRLLTGEMLTAGDPIMRLRATLYRAREFRADKVVALVFKTWNRWRKGHQYHPKAGLKINDGEPLARPI